MKICDNFTNVGECQIPTNPKTINESLKYFILPKELKLINPDFHGTAK